MKLVGITQRVEKVGSYRERRDCLDQRWHLVAEKMRWILVPLPNVSPGRAQSLVENLRLSAIILSGGNTLAFMNPDAADAAPERDTFEATLIDLAVDKQMPLLGVCRGMQTINQYFGGELGLIDHHAATRHDLLFRYGQNVLSLNVNSYHDVAVTKSAADFQILAQHPDGTTEAFKHPARKITGIMWHPEREAELQPQDRKLLEEALS